MKMTQYILIPAIVITLAAPLVGVFNNRSDDATPLRDRLIERAVEQRSSDRTTDSSVKEDSSVAPAPGVVEETTRERAGFLRNIVDYLKDRFDRGSSKLTLESGSIMHDGIERTYYYHMPSRGLSTKSLPMLISLHGGGEADGDEYAGMTNYVSLSDKEGFIAVYPNGINAHWNDGRGVTSDADDVGFISALIDYFVKEHDADPNRVYVEGSSNGGMMTYRLACELSDRVAAFGVGIANLPTNLFGSCHPSRPVPILIMNGTADPFMPWHGGYVRGRETKMDGTVISTNETVAFWRNVNSCRGESVTTQLPDVNKGDNSTVKKDEWNDCNGGVSVVLYTVEGGGHARPGNGRAAGSRLVERVLGTVNQDINSGDVFWDFLEGYTLR